MPARFMLLWFLSSLVVYGLVFVATRRDRKSTWKIWKRLVVSVIGGVLVILPLFFLNNLSGV